MKVPQQQGARILVYGKPVDMRKGFTGLEALVESAGLQTRPGSPQEIAQTG